jgi:hypothetical protein
MRCVKRNIGHLCHDEPREGAKKSKLEPENTPGESETPKDGSDTGSNPISQPAKASDAGLDLALPAPLEKSASTASLAQTDPASAPQLPTLASGNQPCQLHLAQLPFAPVTDHSLSFELR